MKQNILFTNYKVTVIIFLKRKGDTMVLLNKFPDGFFEKTRPEAPKKKTDIIPIKWSEKTKKRKATVSLANKKSK